MATETEYEVIITTANGYTGVGGETNVVYLEMVGENGERTTDVNLREILDCTFKPGGKDVFKITTVDVGLPVILNLRFQDTTEKDPWAVRQILVKYGEKQALFPVHDWIVDEMSVTRGKAQLQQKIDNKYVASMRRQEVDKNKILQWVPLIAPSNAARGLPRFVDLVANHAQIGNNVPLIFRPTETWSQMRYENTLPLLELGELKAKFPEIKSLEDYETLFKLLETETGTETTESPSYLSRWDTDEEFGRQQLNSISPTSFEKCTKIPNNCQISGTHVNVLLNGKILEREIKVGKIFIADYSEVFQGVKHNKLTDGNLMYCPDAICLYHVNSSENFVPIAIQLVPNDPQTIFTPKDTPDDWLLAKMYFKVAFANLHEWKYHFTLTHLAMEPFCVALFRCFPRSHPLYKLLRPHLQTIPIINTLARKNLISEGTFMNQGIATEGEDCSRHIFKNFTLEDLMIPDLLRKRGLLDKKNLPKYYYRDDALALWDVMQKFVTDVIVTYYQSDKDVMWDPNLQEFAKEVGEEGYAWEDGNMRGMSVPITTVQQLIRFCTCIIFTSTAQHAAVNFPQYDIYKFVPNNPAAMRLPPHKKGEGSMERILNSLPDEHMAMTLILMLKSLSFYSPEEIYVGEYPVELFTDPEVLVALKQYKKNLEKYAVNVRKRNETTEFPYEHLLPSKVPNSIAI